jgi:phage terminase large subunit-like protein
MDLNKKTDKELLEIAKAVEALNFQNKYKKFYNTFPDTGPLRRELYKPHLQFMAAGKDKRFRVFAGGNRSGKSHTMAYELTCHMTLDYPEWWEGKRFKDISTIWIIAESGALFRDSLQKTLLGDPGEDIGTGMVPLAEKNNGVGLVEWKAMPSIGGAIGSFIVKNKKGKMVSVIVKTNEMSREQFQAAKVDIVAFDEEPRPDIYTECLMRLMGTGKEPGIALFAFTPLKGLSEVVLKFLPNGEFPERGSPIDEPDKFICRVEWQDVPHLSQADKDTMLREIPAQERDARTKGIPSLGSGRIYPVEESYVTCSPFAIPDHWPRAFGLDFASPNGYTAVVWVAEDPNTKIRYIYAEYKRSKEIDEFHIEAIKTKGAWIPGGHDPTSGVRDNGTMRSDFYRSKGLDIVAGNNAIIGGISSLLSQFETGTLKIFSHCEQLLKEYRLYRYDSKDPNKPARDQQDHLLDALRYVDSVFEWIAKSKTSTEPMDYRQHKSRMHRDSTTGY